MVNTSFKLKLEVEGKEKEVEVVFQEVSPFVSADIFSSALDVESRNYKIGTVVEQGIKHLVVSPKNLSEQIAKSDKPMQAITKLYTEIQSFCSSPKLYKLKNIEGKRKEEIKGVEHDTSKPDTNGSETND